MVEVADPDPAPRRARQLLAQHPAAARDLHIGRPDLPRQYDDGGLVDLNGVPEHVLAALPGVGPQRARLIVADRNLRGVFASVDDLVTRGLLPAPLVSALRERLVVIP